MGDNLDSLFEYVKLAQEKLEAGNTKDAEKLFKESTKKYGNDAHSWYNYGVFLERIGKTKDARKAYEKAIKLNATFGSAISNSGLILLKEKGADAALNWFKSAVKKHGENEGLTNVWNNLGGIYYVKKMHREAESAYRVSVKLNPYGSGPGCLGRVLYVQDKKDEARDVIRQAYGDIAAENYLRYCSFCQLGYVGFIYPTSPKVEELKEIAEEFPDNHQTWFELGNAQVFEGKTDAAIESFKRCTEAKPDFFEGWLNYGAALYKRGMYEDAIDALQRAVSIDSTHAACYENLRRVYEDIGRFDEAMDATKKLMEINPNNELFIDVSRLYLWQEKMDEAFESYTKAIGEDLPPNSAASWIQFGKHLLNSNPRNAQGCFQKALDFNKEDPEAWFYSGYAFLLNDAIMPAQAMFMQSLQRSKLYKSQIMKLLAERGIPPGILSMF